MAKRIFILTVLGIILLVSITAFIHSPGSEQRILDSTVMISIRVPEYEVESDEAEAASAVDEGLPIPPDEYLPVARLARYAKSMGLGTMANVNGQLLIVTHDHWSKIDAKLGEVQIKDGRGQLLVEMQLLQFKELIQYRDGGTMILSAPEELAALLEPKQTTALARSLPQNVDLHELDVGDEVSLSYRGRDGEEGVAVMQAEVEGIGEKQGLPVLRLSTPEGQSIVGGDSGGGVWFEGQLVANNWTTIMMEDVQTGEQRPAGSSVAALISNAWRG